MATAIVGSHDLRALCEAVVAFHKSRQLRSAALTTLGASYVELPIAWSQNIADMYIYVYLDTYIYICIIYRTMLSYTPDIPLIRILVLLTRLADIIHRLLAVPGTPSPPGCLNPSRQP